MHTKKIYHVLLDKKKWKTKRKKKKKKEKKNLKIEKKKKKEKLDTFLKKVISQQMPVLLICK